MKEGKDIIMKFNSIMEHFIYTPNPAIFMNVKNIIFKDKVKRKFDNAEVALLSNSAWNLRYCIEIAKYFLSLSSRKNVQKITNRKPNSFESKNRHEDFILAIQHRFLLPSILFYNASFDYIYILIFFLSMNRKEIIDLKQTGKNKVLNEMKKLDLSNKKHSWIFALNSLITRNLTRNLKGEIEKRLDKNFNSAFIDMFDEIKEENKKLKKNHYANIIKHQLIPFFKPVSLDNVGGAKVFPDINKFYSKNNHSLPITFAISEIVLNIENSQKFLVQYHNKTIKVFNYLLDRIQDKKQGQ